MSGNKIGRRDVLKLLSVAGAGGLGLVGMAAADSEVGALMPSKGWMKASGQKCEGDGTPLQFIPKRDPDADPLKDELTKYPTCPYCGMDRAELHHSRHLVHYDDGVADGTCSLHCLAISLSLNMDRGPKAIYAADFGSSADVKPLVNVDKAGYLIGSRLKGTMTMKSKVAFASADAAKNEQAKHDGRVGSFEEALTESYLDMAQDTMMIRKRRAERRAKMSQKDAPQK